jgi:hypothetical protein
MALLAPLADLRLYGGIPKKRVLGNVEAMALLARPGAKIVPVLMSRFACAS